MPGILGSAGAPRIPGTPGAPGNCSSSSDRSWYWRRSTRKRAGLACVPPQRLGGANAPVGLPRLGLVAGDDDAVVVNPLDALGVAVDHLQGRAGRVQTVWAGSAGSIASSLLGAACQQASTFFCGKVAWLQQRGVHSSMALGALALGAAAVPGRSVAAAGQCQPVRALPTMPPRRAAGQATSDRQQRLAPVTARRARAGAVRHPRYQMLLSITPEYHCCTAWRAAVQRAHLAVVVPGQVEDLPLLACELKGIHVKVAHLPTGPRRGTKARRSVATPGACAGCQRGARSARRSGRRAAPVP